MADHAQIIAKYPIGTALAQFRNDVVSTYEDDANLPELVIEHLGEKDIRRLALRLATKLTALPITAKLPSCRGDEHLVADILCVFAAGECVDVDIVKSLLRASLASNIDDVFLWDQVYSMITSTTKTAIDGTKTPPPSSRRYATTTTLKSTPYSRTTASIPLTLERRPEMDKLLTIELGKGFVDVPGFYEAYFGHVPGLNAMSRAVFEECTRGDSPLFVHGVQNGDGVVGWSDWPKSADEPLTPRRRLWTESSKYINTLIKRKFDISFVTALAPKSVDNAAGDNNDHDHHQPTIPVYRLASRSWSQVMAFGELKSQATADRSTATRIDLATYVREVFKAQHTRRFVLGFTLCSSMMRIWAYDRLGAIASNCFDINLDGQRFVSIMLAFLGTEDEYLGLDPTVNEENGQKVMGITKSDGSTERLVLDTLIGHRQDNADQKTRYLIKDSWQHIERGDSEGLLLQEATRCGVINVSRYHHHEIIHVRGEQDDIKGNVRRGLYTSQALPCILEAPTDSPSGIVSLEENPYSLKTSQPTSGTENSDVVVNSSNKRKSNLRDDAENYPSSTKRSRKSGTSTPARHNFNRLHHRIILRDIGRPIYMASSKTALLKAFEDCIRGHQSLRQKAGILHRDISIANMLINEGEISNSPWTGFLIDLDLAIKENRPCSSGAPSMTGTFVFMAIGVLRQEQHSFMHDLESFFWVLFWICVHYKEGNRWRAYKRIDLWNKLDEISLWSLKAGIISSESSLDTWIDEAFTPYYKPLRPLFRELRCHVFPGNNVWKAEDESLYSKMIDAFAGARARLAEAGLQ